MDKLDYQSAGVNKQAGYDTVTKIKSYAQKTHNHRVLNHLGAFGAFYDLSGYQHPVLVSGTDGVGTKLKIAFQLGIYDTIGIDAVAMCVNDILCHGAKPQFFLDYLACGKLDPDQASLIVKGIADGCTQAECALIGGETAEMPDFYAKGDYDIAGFAVGVVEKNQLIDGSKPKKDDVLIGLHSSGFHSNGFSLLRKIFPDLNQKIVINQQETTIGKYLLTPTKIYVNQVLSALKNFTINGLVHITGGGIVENLPRGFSDSLVAVVDKSAFPDFPLKNQLFDLVNETECYETFNMGIGFIVISPKDYADQLIKFFQDNNQSASIIGYLDQKSSAKDSKIRFS